MERKKDIDIWYIAERNPAQNLLRPHAIVLYPKQSTPIHLHEALSGQTYSSRLWTPDRTLAPRTKDRQWYPLEALEGGDCTKNVPLSYRMYIIFILLAIDLKLLISFRFTIFSIARLMAD